jgi:hypothetical protein
MLRESDECYVVGATNGEPECLAADDPMLMTRLLDDVNTCGFVVEYVIASVGSQPLAAACDALVECCESIPPENRRTQHCYDALERPRLDCVARREGHLSSYGCSAGSSQDGGVDGGGSSAADAGASGSSLRYALCCYHVCGHNHCI